jgi:hypothetical protein
MPSTTCASKRLQVQPSALRRGQWAEITLQRLSLLLHTSLLPINMRHILRFAAEKLSTDLDLTRIQFCGHLFCFL